MNLLLDVKGEMVVFGKSLGDTFPEWVKDAKALAYTQGHQYAMFVYEGIIVRASLGSSSELLLRDVRRARYGHLGNAVGPKCCEHLTDEDLQEDELARAAYDVNHIFTLLMGLISEEVRAELDRENVVASGIKGERIKQTTRLVLSMKDLARLSIRLERAQAGAQAQEVAKAEPVAETVAS